MPLQLAREIRECRLQPVGSGGKPFKMLGAGCPTCRLAMRVSLASFKKLTDTWKGTYIRNKSKQGENKKEKYQKRRKERRNGFCRCEPFEPPPPGV